MSRLTPPRRQPARSPPRSKVTASTTSPNSCSSRVPSTSAEVVEVVDAGGLRGRLVGRGVDLLRVATWLVRRLLLAPLHDELATGVDAVGVRLLHGLADG